jgi:dephospho-CoA kinase
MASGMGRAGVRYVIGLTGNIGAGKSTVLLMLQELGAQAIDADAVARDVMKPGQQAYCEILDAFGQGILGPSGGIDRAELGRRAFSNPVALQRLEQIVHPAVVDHIAHQIEHACSTVVVVEAIKLIESGMVARFCDALWVVCAPMEKRLERLMRNRGMERDIALQRIAAQPPQEEKVAVANVIIDNSGTLEGTKAQVLAAWERLPAGVRRAARKRACEMIVSPPTGAGS